MDRSRLARRRHGVRRGASRARARGNRRRMRARPHRRPDVPPRWPRNPVLDREMKGRLPAPRRDGSRGSSRSCSSPRRLRCTLAHVVHDGLGCRCLGCSRFRRSSSPRRHGGGRHGASIRSARTPLRTRPASPRLSRRGISSSANSGTPRRFAAVSHRAARAPRRSARRSACSRRSRSCSRPSPGSVALAGWAVFALSQSLYHAERIRRAFGRWAPFAIFAILVSATYAAGLYNVFVDESDSLCSCPVAFVRTGRVHAPAVAATAHCGRTRRTRPSRAERPATWAFARSAVSSGNRRLLRFSGSTSIAVLFHTYRRAGWTDDPLRSLADAVRPGGSLVLAAGLSSGADLRASRGRPAPSTGRRLVARTVLLAVLRGRSRSRARDRDQGPVGRLRARHLRDVLPQALAAGRRSRQG